MRHLNHEFALKSWFSAITIFSELLLINSDIQITSRYQVQKMYIVFILQIRVLALVLIVFSCYRFQISTLGHFINTSKLHYSVLYLMIRVAITHQAHNIFVYD